MWINEWNLTKVFVHCPGFLFTSIVVTNINLMHESTEHWKYSHTDRQLIFVLIFKTHKTINFGKWFSKVTISEVTGQSNGSALDWQLRWKKIEMDRRIVKSNSTRYENKISNYMENVPHTKSCFVYSVLCIVYCNPLKQWLVWD